MRVRFLVSIASEDFSHRPGEIAYIEKELAEKWIASGVAVSVDAPKPTTVEARKS
jgi:hypothetical protein